MRESEIQDLKFEVSKMTSELTLAQRDSAAQLQRLQAELDAVKQEAADVRSQKRDLDRQVKAQATTISSLETTNADLSRAREAHELELKVVQTQSAEQLLRAREAFEAQLAAVRSQFQQLEDAAVQAKRAEDAAKRDATAYRTLLEAEKETVRIRVGEKMKLEQQVEQQHTVLADLDKINGDIRAELASTKARLVVAEEKAGRTVVRLCSSSSPFLALC